MHLKHDVFVAGEDHVFAQSGGEDLPARDVHPGVKHSTVGVGDFDHTQFVRVKGLFSHGLHGHRVNGRAWESVASLLYGDVDRCCGCAGHGQGCPAPIHVDVSD